MMDEQAFHRDMSEEEAIRFLKKALPASDRITVDDRAITDIAQHALAVRRTVPWGSLIPEELFKAYVLFPRVNNEYPAAYHSIIWDQLKDRIRGMSMSEAVLEINFWCCENVTYQSTDERTLDALSVLRRGFGRCGEESTLLVSALRSLCIPARQVYVPRWSHCDDNHAWVEAWTDGAWHYLGACEPEPQLDSGWFTAGASKAMFIHTRAFGVCPSGERIEKAEGFVYDINRTAAYADTTLLKVHVTDGGRPCYGAAVRFEIANAGEFFPLIEKKTDENGNAELLVGLGMLRVHAYKNARCIGRMVDTRRETLYELELPQNVEQQKTAVSFEQRPPVETRIQPSNYATEVVREHEMRLKRCDELRAERTNAFSDHGFFCNARGNGDEIEAFLSMPEFAAEDKALLLGTLRAKDLVDADRDMLADALRCALRYRRDYPFDIWKESVLCPRIADEKLTKHREFLRSRLPDVPPDAAALWTHLKNSVRILDDRQSFLIPDFSRIYEMGLCPAAAFDVFFVACARALGIAARINRKDAVIEIYRNGVYEPLFSSDAESAVLRIESADGCALHYGINYTISELTGGVYRTLRLENTAPASNAAFSLRPGSYRIMTCTRQIDGTVDGKLIPVELKPGQDAACVIGFPPERIGDKLLNVKLPDLFGTPCRTGKAAVSLFDALEGRDGIIACIAPDNEPTEHFLNELLDAGQLIGDTGIPILLLLQRQEDLRDKKLQTVLKAIETSVAFFTEQPETLLAWRRLMHAGDIRLPFACAVSAEGSGLFAFANYNVGSARALLRVLEIDRREA